MSRNRDQRETAGCRDGDVIFIVLHRFSIICNIPDADKSADVLKGPPPHWLVSGTLAGARRGRGGVADRLQSSRRAHHPPHRQGWKARSCSLVITEPRPADLPRGPNAGRGSQGPIGR